MFAFLAAGLLSPLCALAASIDATLIATAWRTRWRSAPPGATSRTASSNDLPDGSLIVSDDYAGGIYRISYDR